MKKKITIIATCSLAAITVIASTSLMSKDSNDKKNNKQSAVEVQTEQETAVIGITNITSVGATLDVTGDNLTAGLNGQATGQVSLYNAGVALKVVWSDMIELYVLQNQLNMIWSELLT